MITFYYHPSPNPSKVALLLEEIGAPYELVLVDTHKGEQHSASYKAINPNAKTPALVDDDVTIFDSSAILLYLAEKAGRFLPTDTIASRGQMYSWLMFLATGVAPFTGQYAHFKFFAPEPIPYALNRYEFEAWRHWNIVDARLAEHAHMLGDDYTLVDMAVWGWARVIPFVLGVDALKKLPNVSRLLHQINERPAAQRAEALKSRQPYKTEFDAEALTMLFPQNTHPKA
jgi:GST-like protein